MQERRNQGVRLVKGMMFRSSNSVVSKFLKWRFSQRYLSARQQAGDLCRLLVKWLFHFFCWVQPRLTPADHSSLNRKGSEKPGWNGLMSTATRSMRPERCRQLPGDGLPSQNGYTGNSEAPAGSSIGVAQYTIMLREQFLVGIQLFRNL